MVESDFQNELSQLIDKGREIINYNSYEDIQKKHIEWLAKVTAFLTGNNLKADALTFKPDEYLDYEKLNKGEQKSLKNIIFQETNDLLKIMRRQSFKENPNITSVETTTKKQLEGYQFQEKLGHGGFGEVYRYQHSFLEMNFAIKFFSPAFYNGDKKILQRFFREAKILFQLDHPNIVRVYDVNLEGEYPYIRMEFLEGKDLNKVLMEKGTFTPKDALKIIKILVTGLEHAHEKKVVHRDLKPQNIMVLNDDRIKIIDFGIGAFIEEKLENRITEFGEESVPGGSYTAPELNNDPLILDPSTDIYSIGVIWYEILVGKLPKGNGFEKLLNNSVSNVDSKYVEIIMRCLSSEPEKRYKGCNDLLVDISSLEELVFL